MKRLEPMAIFSTRHSEPLYSLQHTFGLMICMVASDPGPGGVGGVATMMIPPAYYKDKGMEKPKTLSMLFLLPPVWAIVEQVGIIPSIGPNMRDIPYYQKTIFEW